MTLGRQHLAKLNLISFTFLIIPTSILHNKSKHFRSGTKRLKTESQFLPFAVKVKILKFLYRPVAEPGDKKAVQKHRPTIRQRERKGTLSFLSLGLRRIQENVIYSTHLNRFQNPTWFPGWQLTYSVQFVCQLFARAQAP